MRTVAPRGVPWVTLAFVAAAIAVGSSPSARALLGFARDTPGHGQAWRALSSQLVHASPVMAALDLGVVLLCGAWLERRDRTAAVLAMLSGALAVAWTIVAWQPQVVTYQGSSGIAAALFIAAAVHLAQTTSGAARMLALLAVTAALAKAALEQWTGWRWSDAHLPAGLALLPAAHLAGSLAGLATALVAGALAARRAPRRSAAP